MRIFFLSIRLFLYGYFCDICVNICTVAVEKALNNHIPLNKKLLTAMSNFSNNNLSKWKTMESQYIRLCLDQGFFGL